MQAIKLKATVGQNRTLSLQLPSTIMPGDVEVLVLQGMNEQATNLANLLVDIENSLENSESLGQPLQVLNERITQERSSWE